MLKCGKDYSDRREREQGTAGSQPESAVVQRVILRTEALAERFSGRQGPAVAGPRRPRDDAGTIPHVCNPSNKNGAFCDASWVKQTICCFPAAENRYIFFNERYMMAFTFVFNFPKGLKHGEMASTKNRQRLYRLVSGVGVAL